VVGRATRRGPAIARDRGRRALARWRTRALPRRSTRAPRAPLPFAIPLRRAADSGSLRLAEPDQHAGHHLGRQLGLSASPAARAIRRGSGRGGRHGRVAGFDWRVGTIAENRWTTPARLAQTARRGDDM